MRFEPPKIEISPSAPWKRSAFDLEETGIRLSRLVKQIEGPAVISLNAPWGTGKTTFLDMWTHHLKNDGAKVIKFSAWEVDHTDEPLIAIIQELSGQLELGNQSERLEKIKQSTTKLLKQVSPTVLRLLTSGVVNIDGMGDLAEEVVKAKLESHENAKSSAENFRKQLEELAQHVKDENAHYPLILIIDELDRCRPTYAVETLEVIKHFFNVDNVVFVEPVNQIV